MQIYLLHSVSYTYCIQIHVLHVSLYVASKVPMCPHLPLCALCIPYLPLYAILVPLCTLYAMYVPFTCSHVPFTSHKYMSHMCLPTFPLCVPYMTSTCALCAPIYSHTCPLCAIYVTPFMSTMCLYVPLTCPLCASICPYCPYEPPTCPLHEPYMSSIYPHT